MTDEKALVLFSGGQDSATCLAWALDRFAHVETLGFDYGQRHRVELECRDTFRRRLAERFPRWAAKLGPDHTLPLEALSQVSDTAMTAEIAIRMREDGLPNTFVPGRNLLFVTFAAALAYRRGLRHLVGGMCETDYSGYPDCRHETMEAMARALSLGLDKPVVIDMFCYRRHGHNEGDEPAFTQPVMYKKIASHPTTLEIYAKRLVADGVMTEGEVDKAKADWRARLDAEFEAGAGYKPNKADWLDGKWAGFKIADQEEDARRGVTGVDLAVLKEIGRKITKVPDGFRVHRTIQRFLDNRAKAIDSGIGIDWATGEALAFCTLLQEGHHVRLSGQDSERGTFSQRHSVLIDQEDESRYTPFNHLGGEDTGHYEVINSLLSEEAVLGFEYGYSLAEPNALALWEAQFGDFANGAQVVFDQFISSGERKWLRMSGLVCLLPHGYEGQGPEHSSARLERYLQMCAEDNMQVVNPTTPANYFHVLRRQLHREIRKPLILMTPKSLLRHKRAVSRLDELGKSATFHRILYDDAQMLPDEKIKLVPDDKIRRVVLCSGKVYYDLYEEREKRGIDDIYLMRIEQLYPVPLKALVQEFGRFKNAEMVWCQEEPRNMGSWHFIESYLEWVLNQTNAANKRPRYAGRPASAATATGLMSKHLAQLKALLDDALN